MIFILFCAASRLLQLPDVGPCQVEEGVTISAVGQENIPENHSGQKDGNCWSPEKIVHLPSPFRLKHVHMGNKRKGKFHRLNENPGRFSKVSMSAEVPSLSTNFPLFLCF